jgi:hypothetical protein
MTPGKDRPTVEGRDSRHPRRVGQHPDRPYERVGAVVRPLANVSPQLTPFRNLLDDIRRGKPVGHATQDLSAKYARLSHELTLLREAAPGNAPPSDADLAYAWLECADYQNNVLLGDPAVRLRVALLLPRQE